MSTFLGYQSYLIPLGSTVLNTHTTIRGALTGAGWQIVHDSTLTSIQSVLGTWDNATYPIAGAFNFTWSQVVQGIGTLPRWAGIQLVNSTQMTQVVIGGGISGGNSCPKNFTIDYSDNGSDWTTALTVTNSTNWYAYERRYFNIPAVGNHVYWRVNFTANNGDASWCSITAIIFMDQYGNEATTLPVVSGKTYFDCIPPSSETIGDTNGRDLIRFEFTSTTISMRPTYQSISGIPQIVQIWQNTAGNVQYSITLGGITVQQSAGTMSAGNTSYQNLKYLYDAIKTSVDATITNWNWEYSAAATQNGNDAADYILGRCKTITAPGSWDLPITSANASSAQVGYSVQPGATVNSYPYSNPGHAQSVTIDLINGFIFYLQISSRGLALAIKTNTTYYGPIHACYGDHAIAVAAKPTLAYPYDATMIELLVGLDMDSTQMYARAWPTKYWSIFSSSPKGPQDLSGSFGHPLSRGIFRTKIQDGIGYDSWATGNAYINLAGSNIWFGDNVIGNSFQIHRVSAQGLATVAQAATLGSLNITLVLPQINVSDWYKFRGTASNEALLLVADTVVYSILQANLLSTDNSPATIDLSSTAGFNSQGFVAINDEVFSYTGISGNSLTGITRAQYGSTKRSNYTGDFVYQCLWFTVINGGALLCGYTKPS